MSKGTRNSVEVLHVECLDLCIESGLGFFHIDYAVELRIKII